MNNGKTIPSIGLGTHQIEFDDHESLVLAIMNAGYCHIDTAAVYGNEETVGKALKECFKKGKKREDIFVTTKLWHT